MTGSELQRRLVHSSGAVIPVSYMLGVVSWETVMVVFVLGTGVTGILEFVRLRMGLDWVVYRQLTREYEQARLAGYAYYVLGGTIAVVVFPANIAVPALLMLMLVDPISGWLGSTGPGERKQFHVLLVTFVLSFVVAFPFVSGVTAVVGAVAVTIADGMTPIIAGRVVDDNLTIPVGGGGAMWLSGIIIPRLL